MAQEFLYHPIGNYQIKKQPSEVITLRGNFGEVLEEGENIDINNSTVTVYDSNNQDVTSTMLVSNSVKTDPTNTKLQCRIKSGTDGQRYKVSLIAVTSEGNAYEMDVFMDIIEV